MSVCVCVCVCVCICRKIIIHDLYRLIGTIRTHTVGMWYNYTEDSETTNCTG